MSIKNSIIISKEKIQNAIENSETMGGAAAFLNIDRRTFKKKAMEYNLYNPKPYYIKKMFILEDILNGKHPQYPTSKLSARLVKEGLKKYKCEECGINKYNGKHISLELDHINGNNNDHSLNNLRLLCPNCHSQTPTYRSKKIKFKKEGAV